MISHIVCDTLQPSSCPTGKHCFRGPEAPRGLCLFNSSRLTDTHTVGAANPGVHPFPTVARSLDGVETLCVAWGEA